MNLGAGMWTFATIAVVLFAALIALGQWLTARQKLVLDLFEKRFQVFMDLRRLVNEAVQLGKLTEPAAINEVLARSQFLFGEDINQPLRELFSLLGELEINRRVGGTIAERFEKILPLFQAYLKMHQKMPELPWSQPD